MQPGGHFPQRRRDSLADARSLRFAPATEMLLHEFVEGNGPRNLPTDQVILEQESPLALFSEGDWMDRRDAERRDVLRSLPLVSSLAAPEPLTEHRAVVGHQIVLDVDGPLGKLDAINGPVRTRLDRCELPLGAPSLQTKPLRSEQRLLPWPADPPAHVSRLRPLPFRRLEHRPDLGNHRCTL